MVSVIAVIADAESLVIYNLDLTENLLCSSFNATVTIIVVDFS